MERRRLLLISLAGSLAAPLAGEAQPATQLPQIAFLATTMPGSSPTTDGFRQGLLDPGSVEGLNRRTFVHALAIAVVAPPLAAGAQMARETARIGFLSPGDRLSRGWQAELLREALRGHGWVEGKNLVIEYRFGEERYERLRALADDLVRLKVDLIFAASAPSAQAAKEATTTIPIVFSTLNDPVRAGLVSSLAFPAPT
jgi:hypothetical protein